MSVAWRLFLAVMFFVITPNVWAQSPYLSEGQQRTRQLEGQILRSNPCSKPDVQNELKRVFNGNGQFTKDHGRLIALTNMTTDLIVFEGGMVTCFGKYTFEDHHVTEMNFTFPYILLTP